MEGGKKPGSSLASELFGEKDSPTTGSSSGIFDSIFAPPPKVFGRESVHSSEAEKKNSGYPAWSAKKGNFNSSEDEKKISGYSTWSAKKDGNGDQEEKMQPFHYSSSIYYGGRDFYNVPPQSAPNPVFSTFNKDGGEDDSGGASRGNWWQGSLYY